MRAIGLHIGGVDIIAEETGPILLEVNPSPGLVGTEQALEENVAAAMMHELIRLAR